jgi:hypothetical protein
VVLDAGVIDGPLALGVDRRSQVVLLRRLASTWKQVYVNTPKKMAS